LTIEQTSGSVCVEILAGIGFQRKKDKAMTAKWKCYTRTFRDSWIRGLKSKDNLQINDTTISGLHLRFYSATGKMVFYLAYTVRHTGIRRNMLLGRWGEYQLPQIRARAIEIRQLINTGRDPMEDQRQERRQTEKENASRIKVKDLLEIYFEKYSRMHKAAATQKTERNKANAYINPIIGELWISELDLPAAIDFYNRVSEQTSFTTAKRVMQLLSAFLNWCELHNYRTLNSNPCARVPKGKIQKKRVKTLSLDEYKRLFAAMDDGLAESPYHPRMFRALRVLMLTGFRSSEITKLKKSELDLDNSFIHLEKSKSNTLDANSKPIAKPSKSFASRWTKAHKTVNTYFRRHAIPQAHSWTCAKHTHGLWNAQDCRICASMISDTL